MNKARLPCLLLFLCLGGCSWNSYRIGAELSPLTEAQEQATLTSVLAQLGPPLRISSLPEGYVMAWEQWQIVERKLGLSLSYVGADFLTIDWGRARTRGTFLLLSFDEKHHLVDRRYHQWDSDAGGGQGIQALVSVVQVVDVNDLTRPLPQHRWGSFALEQLPATLNRASHLGTGDNGIQQRATPTSVGQHSLEWGRSPD